MGKIVTTFAIMDKATALDILKICSSDARQGREEERLTPTMIFNPLLMIIATAVMAVGTKGSVIRKRERVEVAEFEAR